MVGHILALQAPTEKKPGVFPGALSMLILKMYLTLFLATKLHNILQKQ